MASITRAIKFLIEEPSARGLDQDSENRIKVHSRLLRAKPFLKKLYDHYYGMLLSAARSAPAGTALEIGAGSGFLREMSPEVLSMDIARWSGLDLCGDALKLPFKDESLSAILMLNVLHHLQEPAAFFEEADRVLVQNGIIAAVEPYNSRFSRFIYKRLHHEQFDESAEDWNLAGKTPMTSSNQALPWIILVRDKKEFEERFHRLEVESILPHTAFLYLASGGFSLRQLLPSPLFEPIERLESFLVPRHAESLATMATYVIRKSGWNA